MDRAQQPIATPELPAFDAHYYFHDCGLPYERNDHWISFFGGVADAIISELAPTTVLDVGCAKGFLVEALRERGVMAWGIDVSEHAIGEVHDSVREFCAVSSAADELPDQFPRSYDLVTCIEVIEHMPADLSRPAVDRLGSWGVRVLFSSSPNDHAEPTHLNVQPTEVWSELFARSGLVRSFEIDASFLTPWAVVYEHAPMVAHQLVRRYERELSKRIIEVNEVRSSIVALQRRAAEAERVAADSSSLDGDGPARVAELETLLETTRQTLTATEQELAEMRHALAVEAGARSELRLHYDAAVRDRAAGLEQLQAMRIELDRITRARDETERQLVEVRQRTLGGVAGRAKRVVRAALDRIESRVHGST